PEVARSFHSPRTSDDALPYLIPGTRRASSQIASRSSALSRSGTANGSIAIGVCHESPHPATSPTTFRRLRTRALARPTATARARGPRLLPAAAGAPPSAPRGAARPHAVPLVVARAHHVALAGHPRLAEARNGPRVGVARAGALGRRERRLEDALELRAVPVA